MAARKATARKKTSRKSTAKARSTRGGLGGALGRLELPPTLRDYAKQVQRRLDRLERDLARTRADVRRRATRLLREASHQLGRLEARGEAGWRRLTAPYRRQLLDLLKRLEKVLAPPRASSRPTARKKAVRKATRRVRKAVESAADTVEGGFS